ncbi:MAG TPA: hypothetical protein VFK62_11065 [Gaiellaceae bacterium]|jgi:hypothetical protein|nr:hypothetical protein [Gaiellaceae bacterium]
MRTTQDYGPSERYDRPPPDTGYGPEPYGQGWVLFAAIMLGLLGVWNFFEGIAAISNAHVFVANADYIFSGLHTWGWIILILGIFQILAAMVLLSGSEIARWFGIAVAGVNALGQLSFIPAYPVWGLLMFSVDVLIIWALAAYAGKRLRV